MFLIFFRNILSAANVSQFVQPKKHHEHQCVRNNVSSLSSTFIIVVVVIVIARAIAITILIDAAAVDVVIVILH